MTSVLKQYGNCIAKKTPSIQERMIAFLYFRSETSNVAGASPNELRQDFIDVNFGDPNITRLKKYLKKDNRTKKISKDKWILKNEFCDDALAAYGSCLQIKKMEIEPTDSIIPQELTNETRSYLHEIVRQINGCYDATFYDACSVMIRRLVETLIIEVYEHKKIQNKITDTDGNYFMLKKLISQILREPDIHLGRNAKKGLESVKELGDQSAHNRRFLAKQSDIDKIQSNTRTLTEELLHLSNLIK